MRKKIVIAVSIVVAAAGLITIWRIQDRIANASRTEAAILRSLSADDLAMLANSDRNTAETVKSADARKLFLKGMREYLALAAQARRERMAEDSKFISNFEYKKRQMVADLYSDKMTQRDGKPYEVPEAEIHQVWANPANEKQFAADMAVLRELQLENARQRGLPVEAVTPLRGGSLEKARRSWARAKVLSDKAAGDNELMARPELPLRIKVLEAGILSADYLRKHWGERVKAKEAEIEAYLGAHPELDLAKKREKAVDLLRKALDGADFAWLAQDFSEDRNSTKQGGLLKDVAPDSTWPEVAAYARTLSPGQVGEKLIETSLGYHIVKLENVNTAGNDGPQVTFRHILLQKSFPDPSHSMPGVPAPFLTPLEIAAAEVEREKRNRLVAEVLAANPIELPEDFPTA